MPSPFVDSIVNALEGYTTPFPDVRGLPSEPEQTFLLGNRYADYGLAILFAIAFPLLRSILRRFVYSVRKYGAQHPWTDNGARAHVGLGPGGTMTSSLSLQPFVPTCCV